MSRRLSTVLAALIPAILLFFLANSVTVPLVAMGPGPTYDALGTVELDREGTASQVPVIEITGRKAVATSGELDMTTVAVRDQLTLGDAFRFWLDRDYTVLPRDQVFPPNASREEVDATNKAEMVGSENSAEVAAYRRLKLPLVASVDSVTEGGAARGQIKSGDVISSIDGVATPRAEDVASEVAKKAAGEHITVAYVRGGKPGSVGITLGAGTPGDDEKTPDGKPRGYLGISLGDQPKDGTDVRVNIDPKVGGPSAGLIFALAIVDKLDDEDLTGGATVAGTGTIAADGKVGPIGGIRHKILAARNSGATEFLVPAANCREAVISPPDGIRLIKVDTLDGAIDALQAASAGGQPPTCG